MSEVGVHGDFVGAFGVWQRDGCTLLVGNRRRLRPDAEPSLVFDLPGGRVEPGERLVEALEREWGEECGLAIRPGRLLFVQEGLRLVDGRRRYAWRSFFFAVEADGEPEPGDDIHSVLWCPRGRLVAVLHAPYHAGFLRWLGDGAPLQQDVWD
ncbi:MAG: NUDIX hydrolase [Planctomycetota bacterium]